MGMHGTRSLAISGTDFLHLEIADAVSCLIQSPFQGYRPLPKVLATAKFHGTQRNAQEHVLKTTTVCNHSRLGLSWRFAFFSLSHLLVSLTDYTVFLLNSPGMQNAVRNI